MEGEEKMCLYEHCEVDCWGSELCCEKRGNSYCMFDRRDPAIDYSKCPMAELVTPAEWKKHAKSMGWYY